ncbi:MAG: FAD-binding dehydrogenase [Saprospiraceae bacterium]
MQTYQSEVVIVGGGIAGIIAAIELLDSNKKVIIIDRDTKENFGGLAKWSFGGMFFCNSKLQQKRGIKDSIDLATKDWFSYAEFDENEHWGRKWAEQYINYSTPHGYNWLIKNGLTFFPVVNWAERGLNVRGNSVPRFHIVWGTGWGLTHRMIEILKNHPKAGTNLELIFGHRVTEIISENQVIKGIRGTQEATNQPFEAKGEIVIVATGGINGSIERVRKTWDRKAFGEPPKVILNGAHSFAIGDLHDATTNINGNVTNLEKQWNYAAGIRHYAPRKKDHGLSLVPPKSALWLNYQGKRIGPEPMVTAFDTRHLVQRICQEPVKYSWQLLNYKIALKEFAISGSESNELVRDKKFLKFIYQTLVTGNKKLVNQVMEKCEDVVVGHSVEELVEKMNALTGEKHVELNHVQNAISQYDGQIDRGVAFHNDPQLRLITQARQYRGDKSRTCKYQKIVDDKAMPLIAIREFILSRKSLGGIQTNLDGEVLTKPNAQGEQTSIGGLYAIGEAAGFGGGGVHGRRSLEGTFLGGCLITARVAVAAITGKPL